MPSYTPVSPDKFVRLRRFAKSRSLVDCRADENLSVGASLPRHSARVTSSCKSKEKKQPLACYEVARIE
jgi:hypothetical protein